MSGIDRQKIMKFKKEFFPQFDVPEHHWLTGQVKAGSDFSAQDLMTAFH